MRFHLVLLSACIAGVMLLQSCGAGDESDPTATPTADPDSTPFSEALLTPMVPPTVSPDLKLVPYTSQAFPSSYSFAYPEDWERGLGWDGETFQGLRADGVLAAQLSVLCTPGITDTVAGAEGMMALDREVLARYGIATVQSVDDATIDGFPAKIMTYLVQAGPSAGIAMRAAYVVDGTCGWRIRMAAYGLPPFDTYFALFDRLIPEFTTGVQG